MTPQNEQELKTEVKSVVVEPFPQLRAYCAQNSVSMHKLVGTSHIQSILADTLKSATLDSLKLLTQLVSQLIKSKVNPEDQTTIKLVTKFICKVPELLLNCKADTDLTEQYVQSLS